MQILPRYLLINRVQVVTDQSGHVTEYRPVYARQLELYKGIDNTIQFQIVNSDQKPVDVSDQSVRFAAFDSNHKMCLDLPADPVKWDDSTVRIGMFEVVVSHNDLLAIDPQYITYWVKLVDYDGLETLTYSGVQFANSGIARINDTVSPMPTDALAAEFISTAYQNGQWYTAPVALSPGINSNSALHTIVIYNNGFRGLVYIEASLENNTADPNAVWSTVGDPVKLTGQELEPVPVNINGVFNYVRFRTTIDPTGLISKILIKT